MLAKEQCTHSFYLKNNPMAHAYDATTQKLKAEGLEVGEQQRLHRVQPPGPT